MISRRTGLAIAGAATVTFAVVFALTSPPAPAQPGPSVKLPSGGGPARQALAEARTKALHAENEASPVSEVESADFRQPDVFYTDCAAARAAGAAPLYAGEAGYRPALDTDRDGAAC